MSMQILKQARCKRVARKRLGSESLSSCTNAGSPSWQGSGLISRHGAGSNPASANFSDAKLVGMSTAQITPR
jgi:hypothetical protein